MQNTHAEGVSQDLVCLIVVTVSDAGCSNKQFKWIILIQIQCASFDFLLELPHALFPIAVKQNKQSQNHRLSFKKKEKILKRHYHRILNLPAKS